MRYQELILAATFLNEFVDEKVPWVHVDLSSCQRKGGLGHVPSEINGFGEEKRVPGRHDGGSRLERLRGPVPRRGRVRSTSQSRPTTQ